MTDRNDINGNSTKDYLQGASNFIWAAEKICANTEENTGDWLFKLENPVTFLLGHASELILKAGLAKNGLLIKDLKHSHALTRLMEKSQENGIPLNSDFCENVKTINDNFENHDHRYQRTFVGFPDDQYDRLINRINENAKEARKELKDHGLVGKRIPNLVSFLKVAQSQLKTTIKWMENNNRTGTQ